MRVMILEEYLQTHTHIHVHVSVYPVCVSVCVCVCVCLEDEVWSADCDSESTEGGKETERREIQENIYGKFSTSSSRYLHSSSSSLSPSLSRTQAIAGERAR